MRILITNDDGIYASGVLPLVKWAQKLGEVVVVAPKVEQSAKSHGIEIHKSFEAKQVDLLPGVTASTGGRSGFAGENRSACHVGGQGRKAFLQSGLSGLHSNLIEVKE